MHNDLLFPGATAADSTAATAQSTSRRAAVISIVVVAAFAVRMAFFHFQSGDYTAYFGPWFQYIASHGGFHALKTNFSNYNVPYLYLLAIPTYTPVSALLAVKLVSVVFDFLLGFFVYKIVGLRHPGTWWPVLAGAVTLFLPTVVVNSAMWGQVDAMYSSLSLGGLYFVLRKKPWLACVFFGLAFAFKLQAVFIFPLLLVLVLRRYVPWRCLVAIPLVYAMLDIPALLLGASPHDLLTVYTSQTDTYDQLTLNAPNLYQYIGNETTSHTLRTVAVVVTGVVVLALVVAAIASRAELTPLRIILAATVSAIVVPFLLPEMHERYFYLADALTVISAFYLPRRLWPLPILEQFASFFAYLPFLLMTSGRNFGGARPGGAAPPSGTGRSATGGRPGAGGAPSGGFPGGYRGGGRFQGGGQAPQGGAPTPDRGLGAGGGHVGGQHIVVSFTILSTAMLIALLIALWAAIGAFRSRGPWSWRLPRLQLRRPQHGSGVVP